MQRDTLCALSEDKALPIRPSPLPPAGALLEDPLEPSWMLCASLAFVLVWAQRYFHGSLLGSVDFSFLEGWMEE